MKILFLTTNLEGKDGWSRYSLDLINGLKNDNELKVVCENKVEGLDFVQHDILKNSLRYIFNLIVIFKTSLKLKKIINKFDPEIVHVLAEPYASIFLFLPRKKRKLFITVHGTYSVPANRYKGMKAKIARIITREVYNKFDQIISVSSFTKKYLLKNYPKFENKIKVVTNSIKPDKDFVLDKKGPNLEKKILFVGAIKPRKGVLEALEALVEYKKKYNKNFKYFVVGSFSKDYYVKNIQNKIKRYGLEGNVIFLGKVSEKDLISHYKTSDLFLMLPVDDGNKFEGFGLVYLEANQYGVPVIGARKSGAEDAVKDRETGYLVDARNPEEVAGRINDILNKNKIDPENCIDWARKNNIKYKIQEIKSEYEKNTHNI